MKEPRGGITNIIGHGTAIKGDLKVEGSIRIDGTLNGNITVSDTLIVGKTGEIIGEVRTKDTLIGGKIEGSLIVGERAEFQTGSRLKGDIKCKLLVIEEGVIFDGTCAMETGTETKEGLGILKRPLFKTSSEKPPTPSG